MKQWRKACLILITNTSVFTWTRRRKACLILILSACTNWDNEVCLCKVCVWASVCGHGNGVPVQECGASVCVCLSLLNRNASLVRIKGEKGLYYCHVQHTWTENTANLLRVKGEKLAWFPLSAKQNRITCGTKRKTGLDTKTMVFITLNMTCSFSLRSHHFLLRKACLTEFAPPTTQQSAKVLSRETRTRQTWSCRPRCWPTLVFCSGKRFCRQQMDFATLDQRCCCTHSQRSRPLHCCIRTQQIEMQSRMCYHKKNDMNVFIHGDDFVVTTETAVASWFHEALDGRFEVKVSRNGDPQLYENMGIKLRARSPTAWYDAHNCRKRRVWGRLETGTTRGRLKKPSRQHFGRWQLERVSWHSTARTFKSMWKSFAERWWCLRGVRGWSSED